MSTSDEWGHEPDPEIERWIRGAMPRVRAPDDYRQMLRLTLRAQLHQKRRRFLTPAALLAFLAFISIAANETNVGSGDFELVPRGPDGIEKQIFHRVFHDENIGGTDQETLEKILRLREASEKTLEFVYGYSVRGKTYFEGIWRYKVDGETETLTGRTRFPPSSSSPMFIEFEQTRSAELIGLVRSGHAEYLGTDDMMIDGWAVRVHRWRHEFPEWGPVIFYESDPLPPPGWD